MTSLRRLLAAIHMMLMLAGSAVAAEAISTPQAAAPVLQIGPGDQVKVDVFGSSDLNTTTNVADDGTIRMPLVGALAVGGGSPADAALKIEAALKAGQYLVDPHVTVTVVQSLSQRVSVLGEVRNPGRYPIESNTTVLDAMALAGGTTEKGSDVVYILRTDSTGKVQRLQVDLRNLAGSSGTDSAPIQTLRGGDSLVVPKGTFFLTGEVRLPGEYRIEGDMTLVEAIARGGGVTDRGSASRVEVQRRGPDDKLIEVKANKNLRIQPGDVIKVKERIF